MSHVTSKDGTRIAYERVGSGPAVILVDGAMCAVKYFMRIEELAKVLPNARLQVLPGQTHNVGAAVLVPALVAYFKE
jgi:hypothetical protein